MTDQAKVQIPFDGNDTFKKSADIVVLPTIETAEKAKELVLGQNLETNKSTYKASACAHTL